jgi:hypothetical protein
MRIRPKLMSWDNPHGPQWVVPGLSRNEFRQLSLATVMFVARDPNDSEKYATLGSGFIIGVANTLLVATASHIFTEWVDKVCPPPTNMMRGMAGDRDDLNRRLERLIKSHGILASVGREPPLASLLLPIVGMAINSTPRDVDAGVVQLALPKEIVGESFTTIPIDIDPVSYVDPVLLAGFVGGGGRVPRDQEALTAVGCYFEHKLEVRAGRVGQLEERPGGYLSAMYRVKIPSLPGMSGGPLIALRPVEDGGASILTAVGVISSERLSSPILYDNCPDGETLVSPMATMLGRRVLLDGVPTTLSDAVRNGTLPSFGHLATTVELVLEEVDGVTKVTPKIPGRTSS